MSFSSSDDVTSMCHDMHSSIESVVGRRALQSPWRRRATVGISGLSAVLTLTVATAGWHAFTVEAQTADSTEVAMQNGQVPVHSPRGHLHMATESGARTLPYKAATGSVTTNISNRERRKQERLLRGTGSIAPITLLPSEQRPRADNVRGVYMTPSSVARKDFWKETLAAVKEAGGSSIVFDVKGSRVYFHAAAPLANEIGLVSPKYDLPAILAEAKEHGLYTIGRLVAIKDDGLTGKKPDTRVKDPTGKRVLSETWVDPENEMAIDYNSQVVCDLAAAGIDEINLDYIRFSTADFGALRVYSGAEKAAKVEKFIRAMRESIDRCGPNTNLGLSTYAILGWNYDINVATLGQDVKLFAPLVDVISPMAYPATFTSPEYYIPGKNPRSRMYWLVYRTLTGYKELLGEEHANKIRPWIQGYGITTQNFIDQMDAVSDAGFCGFQVWSAGNYYDTVYKALEQNPTRPEKCL